MSMYTLEGFDINDFECTNEDILRDILRAHIFIPVKVSDWVRFYESNLQYAQGMNTEEDLYHFASRREWSDMKDDYIDYHETRVSSLTGRALMSECYEVFYLRDNRLESTESDFDSLVGKGIIKHKELSLTPR